MSKNSSGVSRRIKKIQEQGAARLERERQKIAAKKRKQAEAAQLFACGCSRCGP